jgi:hypothetical protein
MLEALLAEGCSKVTLHGVGSRTLTVERIYGKSEFWRLTPNVPFLDDQESRVEFLDFASHPEAWKAICTWIATNCY